MSYSNGHPAAPYAPPVSRAVASSSHPTTDASPHAIMSDPYNIASHSTVAPPAPPVAQGAYPSSHPSHQYNYAQYPPHAAAAAPPYTPYPQYPATYAQYPPPQPQPSHPPTHAQQNQHNELNPLHQQHSNQPSSVAVAAPVDVPVPYDPAYPSYPPPPQSAYYPPTVHGQPVYHDEHGQPIAYPPPAPYLYPYSSYPPPPPSHLPEHRRSQSPLSFERRIPRRRSRDRSPRALPRDRAYDPRRPRYRSRSRSRSPPRRVGGYGRSRDGGSNRDRHGNVIRDRFTRGGRRQRLDRRDQRGNDKASLMTRYGIEYTLYIGNVPQSIGPNEPEKLSALFEKFGEIKTCSIVRRRDAFQFGHINFTKAEHAAKAMVEMQDYLGMKIRLKDTHKDSETAQQIRELARKFRTESKKE